MAWLNVHPEISHVVIAQHWSARYDSKNVMDWKLKPLPSGEPAYSNSLRAFISELRAMGKQVILLAPTPLIKQNDVAKYIRNLIRRGGNGKRPGKPYLYAAKIQGRSCRRASHP